LIQPTVFHRKFFPARMGDLHPFLRVGGEDYLSFFTCGRNHAILDRVLDPLASTTPLLSGPE
jgi:hypothetical protein